MTITCISFVQSAIVLRGGENKEVRFKGKTVSSFLSLSLFLGVGVGGIVAYHLAVIVNVLW